MVVADKELKTILTSVELCKLQVAYNPISKLVFAAKTSIPIKAQKIEAVFMGVTGMLSNPTSVDVIFCPEDKLIPLYE
jgi:hypothetical protein